LHYIKSAIIELVKEAQPCVLLLHTSTAHSDLLSIPQISIVNCPSNVLIPGSILIKIPLPNLARRFEILRNALSNVEIENIEIIWEFASKTEGFAVDSLKLLARIASLYALNMPHLLLTTFPSEVRIVVKRDHLQQAMKHIYHP